MNEVFRFLGASVDLVHALAMLLWGLGLPLLIWHPSHALSRAYMWFAIVFVSVSVVSQWLLGECVLTTAARALWLAGGGYRDGIPFTALLANTVAGIRPSHRQVVLAWEIAVVTTSVGTLWCWHRTHPKRRGASTATLSALEPPAAKTPQT